MTGPFHRWAAPKRRSLVPWALLILALAALISGAQIALTLPYGG